MNKMHFESNKYIILLIIIISFLITACKTEVEIISTSDYNIRHFLQNIGDDDYSPYQDDDFSLKDVYETEAVSFIIEYEGFSVDRIEIEKDENVKKEITKRNKTQNEKITSTYNVNIYYKRNIVKVTFLLDGGNTETELVDGTLTGKYEDFLFIAPPKKTGYHFEGWSEPLPELFPSKSMTLKAIWTAETEIEYKVEHYQQNIDDDEYTLIEKDTEVFLGTTNTFTNAIANQYEGFKVKEFEQENIAGDMSTVVKIYYDRLISIFTFDLNGGTTETELTAGTLSGRFGQKVEIKDPEKIGYSFEGWSYTVPETFPAYNLTFDAIYSASIYTTYTVEHYKENLYNDDYSLEETEVEYGITDSYTNAVSKDYNGFTVKSYEQIKINGDNSTIVRIYYDRYVSTLTFELNGGRTSTTLYNNTISGKYGTTISFSTPRRTGYTLDSWSEEIPETFPEYSARYEVFWKPNDNTQYIVEHYQQNLTDDSYSLYEREYKEGITDTLSFAEPKEYENFVIQNFYQENIEPDGSTIVKIYYNRIITTLTFELNGGNTNSLLSSNVVKAKAGEKLEIEDPVNDNFIFLRWTPPLPDYVPNHDVTYTAIWHSLPILVNIENNDIDIEYEIKGNIVTLTATPGYSTYTWKVEEEIENNEKNIIDIDTVSWCKGLYNISCTARKGEILYFANIQIKKEAGE